MNEYFQKLKSLCQSMDRDIEELKKKWETPHRFIGEPNNDTEKANIAQFFADLEDLQNTLSKHHDSYTKERIEMDEYITSVNKFYDEVKQSCDDIKTLLSSNSCTDVLETSDILLADESELSNLSVENISNQETPNGKCS